MDVVKYLGVAWLICSCQAVLASQAANCVHDNGQTFINLPGQNNDSPQLKYGIYKQATPFTEQGGQLDISSAQFVAHTDFTKSNSPSIDTKRNPGGYFTLPALNLGRKLNEQDILFVYTPTDIETGTHYYAIVPEYIDNSGSITNQLLASDNVGLCPTGLDELVSKPLPISQGFVLDTYRDDVNVFLLFAPHQDSTATQAMANMPNVPIFFGISGDTTIADQILLVAFHARSGRNNQPYQVFHPSKSMYKPGENSVSLHLHDVISHVNQACQGHNRCNNAVYSSNTFWYGYAAELGRDRRPSGELYCNADDILADKGAVQIEDYTYQTTLFLIDYMRSLTTVNNDPVIDPTKVFAAGHSMAGIGSILTAIWAPENTFAGVYGHAPKLNFTLYDNQSTHGANNADDLWNQDQDERCYGNSLGGSPVEEVPQCTDDVIDNDAGCKIVDPTGAPFYSTRMNGTNYVRHVAQSKSLPPITIFAGKQDSVTNFSGKPDFIDAANDTRQPITFYWDNRGHTTRGSLEAYNIAVDHLDGLTSNSIRIAVSDFSFIPSLPKDSENISWPGDSSWDSGGDPLQGTLNTVAREAGSVNGFVELDTTQESVDEISLSLNLIPLYECILIDNTDQCKCSNTRAPFCDNYDEALHEVAQEDYDIVYNNYYSKRLLPSETASVTVTVRNFSTFSYNISDTYYWQVRDDQGNTMQSGCAENSNASLSALDVLINAEAVTVSFSKDVNLDYCNG